MADKCRTVWHNHLKADEGEREANRKTLAVFRPDFTTIKMCQINSILRHSACLDHDHFVKEGWNNAKARESAPSRMRTHFGLLFDLLNNKF